MQARAWIRWARRGLTANVVAATCALTVAISGALADAGDPIVGTIRASAVDNGNGTITIYVRGQWNWLAHNTDCNFDRAGAGVGIVWNDPTEPGFTVAKGAISAQVGIASLRPGDNVNQIDQMVHPSDRGNQVEGYTVAGTDYPATQQFSDPAPSASPTPAQVASWKGGCGRGPLTATASKGSNPERSGQTCADGTMACPGHPWGSWGYEKNGGLGYAHTYLKTALPSKVCVNFYDVQGGANVNYPMFQVPSKPEEITVDANGENSIQTNTFDGTNGANCVALATPLVASVIHDASHQDVTTVAAGATVHDFVTVTGPTSGNVRLDWFANDTCAGAPQTSASIALDATGHVDATAFAKGPLAAGVYGLKAHFLGSGSYLPADGACEPLRVVDANIQITPATASGPVGTTHTLTGHVNVNDGAGFVNAPNGTVISFGLTGAGSFVGSSSCTIAGGTGSCAVVISSPAPGTSTVKAISNVTVAGIALHRESEGAWKVWGDATVRTDILNGAGSSVTSVVAGTVVHDQVFVARTAGTPAGIPNPTGSVTFHRYATIDCSGPSTDQTVGLIQGSQSTAITDDFAPTVNMSYRADYLGDANYPARSGACESLAVSRVEAPAISIGENPNSQTVAHGGTATFTITVTNSGNVTLTDVAVVDPLSPNCSKTKADIPALASMAPDAVVTYTCTKANVTAGFDNVVTATGSLPSGPSVTAIDTGAVKVASLKPADKPKAKKNKKKTKKNKKKKPKAVSHRKPKATR